MPTVLQAENVESFIDQIKSEDSGKQLIVDFWAAWCGPCRMLSPELDKLEQANSDSVKVLKVDVDANPAVASALNIRSIPTMMFFKNGEQNKPPIIGVTSQGNILKHVNS